jgi:hypothetical protein
VKFGIIKPERQTLFAESNSKTGKTMSNYQYLRLQKNLRRERDNIPPHEMLSVSKQDVIPMLLGLHRHRGAGFPA